MCRAKKEQGVHVLWFMAGILSEPLKGIVKELGAVVVGVVKDFLGLKGLMEIMVCVCVT
jgi:hypothetical protein